MDTGNIPPLNALIILSFIGTPLIMFAWVMLHKKGFATIRSWAVSWFLIFVVLGSIFWLYSNDIWYPLIAIVMAVIGGVAILLLPKSQP
jgi:hypothetical protein